MKTKINCTLLLFVVTGFHAFLHRYYRERETERKQTNKNQLTFLRFFHCSFSRFLFCWFWFFGLFFMGGKHVVITAVTKSHSWNLKKIKLKLNNQTERRQWSRMYWHFNTNGVHNKETFYLTIHSTHCFMALDMVKRKPAWSQCV